MGTMTKTAAARPAIHFAPGAKDAIERHAKEIAAYVRELPRLLKEGEAGRHALIKGDDILSIWDTHGDAVQAGLEKFGFEPLFVKKIDARDAQRFAQLKSLEGETCP